MKKTITIALACSSLLSASSLLQDAKNAGLVAIPTSITALYKLIDNPKNPITKEKVALGEKLYLDPRLSKSNLISCNTCHNLADGGDDGVSASTGHKWRHNPHHLNAPTVFNAVFFDSQFWDGRAKDLEAQAQGPIQASPEMAATPKHVIDTVTSMPEYVNEFKRAYGDDVNISFKKVADTIATFERVLVTPAPYDDFLNGDKNALTKEQKNGLKTFIQLGCTSCHNGIALGGSMNAFNIYAKYKYNNIGDFKGDKNGMVKVPTLRNILKTAPYFHNGQYWDIKNAIKEMGRIQLGIKVSDKQANSIATFFKALDGRKPVLTIPNLPASTVSTPKPDLN